MLPTPLEQEAPLLCLVPLVMRFIGSFWAIDDMENPFHCLETLRHQSMDSSLALAMSGSDVPGRFFGMSK